MRSPITPLRCSTKPSLPPSTGDQIHQLISNMDDVIDYIDGAARRLILYGVTEIPIDLVELAKILHRSTLEVQKAVGQFEKPEKRARISWLPALRSTSLKTTGIPSATRPSPSYSKKKRTRSRFWFGRKFTRAWKPPSTAARTWPISSRAWCWKTPENQPTVKPLFTGYFERNLMTPVFVKRHGTNSVIIFYILN